MRSLLSAFMAALLITSPVHALALEFTTAEAVSAVEVTSIEKTERDSIRVKTVEISAAILDAGRVRKVIKFRGNKSVRFAEFENLSLSPQQEHAKGLLNSAKMVANSGVVNYAGLPEVNAQAKAVEQVETKITERGRNNPAIAGYGRTRGGVYGSLNLKRAQDAKAEVALQAKLAQFQASPSRIQEKQIRVDLFDNMVN